MNGDLKEFMERALGDADGDDLVRICIGFAELALRYREALTGGAMPPDDDVSLVIRVMKAARDGGK